MDVKTRFLNYIAFDTASDEDSTTCPSSQKQLELGKFLLEECKTMGMQDVKIDSNGYVTAVIPANTKGLPKIGFIAHMDTSPDASGKNVQPIIKENYDGSVIQRTGPDLSPHDFPKLLDYQGQTIITSDGTTLLGADDKAGIAEILTAMEYILAHPEIPHGRITVGFTPDEEIGRGADLFDVKGFDCDFAYTIDGGTVGELEFENFNAARAKITIRGINVHPGTSKDLMKNAALIGTELAGLLPPEETPAHTEGYEGFFHLISFKGTVAECKMAYIIRDFDRKNFKNRKKLIIDEVARLNEKYGEIISLELRDEYYNMIEKILPNKYIVDLAQKSMEDCGISPIIKPIRGGTDGARLSFEGLPCPNIFAGGHNFHGIYEFIPLESMEKAVKVIIKIIENSTALKNTN